jgi:hypothetical protein
MAGFHRMYGGHDGEYAGRNPNDMYPTPPFVTYALTTVEDLPRRLWEPACGRGWMSRELIRVGHSVASSDAFRYDDPLVSDIGIADFLDASAPRAAADGVVTNPPYARNLAEAFIRTAIRDYDYSAFLLRLTFAESQRRLDLFTEYPPARVYAFSQRFSCREEKFEANPLGGMVAFAWWVWDYRNARKDPKHILPPRVTTEMHWIDTRDVYGRWKKSL